MCYSTKLGNSPHRQLVAVLLTLILLTRLLDEVMVMMVMMMLLLLVHLLLRRIVRHAYVIMSILISVLDMLLLLLLVLGLQILIAMLRIAVPKECHISSDRLPWLCMANDRAIRCRRCKARMVASAFIDQRRSGPVASLTRRTVVKRVLWGQAICIHAVRVAVGHVRDSLRAVRWE